jgi:hypothetical protein
MKPILVAMLLASALVYLTEDAPGEFARVSTAAAPAARANSPW